MVSVAFTGRGAASTNAPISSAARDAPPASRNDTPSAAALSRNRRSPSTCSTAVRSASAVAFVFGSITPAPSFATWLRSLLGAHAIIVPVEDVAAAASLYAEYRAGERDAEGRDWALVRHAWPLEDVDEAVEALHRLSNNLGSRDVWLILPDREPQACALTADMVLDNPLGFAALARNELALMDRAVPAGLSFQRYDLSTEDGATYVIPAGPAFAIERVNQLLRDRRTDIYGEMLGAQVKRGWY